MSLWSSGLAKSRDKRKKYIFTTIQYLWHQTWQGGEITWRTNTYDVLQSPNHVLLWGHVTYWVLHISICSRAMATRRTFIHKFTQPFKHMSPDKLKTSHLHCHNAYGHNDLSWCWDTIRNSHIWIRMTPQFAVPVRPRKKFSTRRRPLNTKLGRLLTYSERLPSFKPHDSFIKWPTWGHVTIKKMYISTIIRLMASKPGRVLTYWKRFRTQALKSSPTCLSCRYFWTNCQKFF